MDRRDPAADTCRASCNYSDKKECLNLKLNGDISTQQRQEVKKFSPALCNGLKLAIPPGAVRQKDLRSASWPGFALPSKEGECVSMHATPPAEEEQAYFIR